MRPPLDLTTDYRSDFKKRKMEHAARVCGPRKLWFHINANANTSCAIFHFRKFTYIHSLKSHTIYMLIINWLCSSQFAIALVIMFHICCQIPTLAANDFHTSISDIFKFLTSTCPDFCSSHLKTLIFFFHLLSFHQIFPLWPSALN